MTRLAEASQTGLHRGIGLMGATGSGVAIIIGAGIYVLMGEAAARAGNAIWLSFALAGTAAFFTALSYAELSAMLPTAAAGYTYTRAAFGEAAGYVVGWLTIVSQVVSLSAVSLGFGSYVQDQLGFPGMTAALALAVSAVLLGLRGVREPVLMGGLLALLEVGGLVVIIVAGAFHFGAVDYLETASGGSGIFSAASLLFFAFLGFEQVANLAQETRNPWRNLPLAIMLSGGISAALYILTSLAAVSILGWLTLSQSDAPLAAVARASLGERGAEALSLVAIVATASTVLIGTVAATRTVYGMAAGGALPRILSAVHARYRTPWVASIAVGLVAVGGILTRDVGFAAEVTNFTILLAFVAVNLALVQLRRSRPSAPRPFRVPGSIGWVPVASVLGALTSSALLAGTGLLPAVFGLLVALAAWALYSLKTRLTGRDVRADLSDRRKDKR